MTMELSLPIEAGLPSPTHCSLKGVDEALLKMSCEYPFGHSQATTELSLVVRRLKKYLARTENILYWF